MSKAKSLSLIFILMLASSVMIAAYGHALVNATEIAVINPDTGDSNFIFYTDTTSVGTRFNATAWVYGVTDLYAYQVYLHVDDSLLNITNAWLPVWDPNWVFYGKASVRPIPTLYDFDENGYMEYVRVADSIMGVDSFTGSGTLAVIEFEIIYAPTAGSVSCNLDIDNADTYLLNFDMDDIPTTKTSGYYEYIAPIGPPEPPVAAFSWSPDIPAAGQLVTFDASESYDPDGTIVSYSWDFGDGFTGSGVIVDHVYDTAGSYVVVLTVTDDDGLTDTESKTITIGEPTPPPIGEIQVKWANYSTREYPCGDPRYPFGGNYHNGEYHMWKNFTVINGVDENIVYISVQYPEATPSFKPSKYMIQVIPLHDPCWTINVNLEDRLIEFFAQEGGGIPPGACAIVSVEFKDGPTQEDCKVGHMFDVTVSLKSCYAETFQLTEYIDKTPPNIEITFPEATSPDQNYAFIKRKDGYIWLLLPDCNDKNVRWLWINGTASDGCSGINRVEIWINGTYMGDATLSGPIGSKGVSWWWYTDPTKDPDFWEHEAWYWVVARAYDNSVNDEETVMHGSKNIPKTNFKDTGKHWFFWIGVEAPVVVVCENYEPLDWVPGNGRIDVWGKTGFYPNTEVEIWLENELYGVKEILKTLTADYYGRFYVTINHLPEVPRKPVCDDHWVVRAVQPSKNLEGADHFAIIPWITYEDTMAQNDPNTWQTTKTGHVDDTIMVYGHGFLPSRQAKWDPYCTVYVRIVYTEVAPAPSNAWTYRSVFNGTSQFHWDNLEWYPRLNEVVLAEVPTDENGYWSAKITIPQSYGGLHAIYAYEHKIVADLGKKCPEVDFVYSGWPQCTGRDDEWLYDKEAQSVIFDVWPTIKVPSTAITGQYITITGEGLPLPRYYELWINSMPVVARQDWCLVLDFGPFEQWVFENKRIRNNELDLSWAMGGWYPFSFYTPDPAWFLESPVWKGKLCSITVDFEELYEEVYQFHIGSKYLKVPILPASNYEIKIYYFDKHTDTFVHDHDAVTSLTVLKDPLNINAEVGEIHFPGEIVNVFARVDVDGIATDATTLSLELYKGEIFIETLSHKKIGTGLYVATFECPTEEGDYFIKASANKEYELFTLYGSAIAGFTVNPTISSFNAKLVDLEGKLATVLTDLGQIKVDLSDLNSRVVAIEGTVMTIVTDIGTLQADADAVNTKIVGIEGRVITIESDVGTLRTDVSSVNARVVNIDESMFTIETDIEMLRASVSDIDAKVVAIEGRAVTIETNVGMLQTLQADVSDINAKIVEIEGKAIKIETDVGTLLAELGDINGIVTIENDMATITTDLGEIKGKVDELEGDVATIKTNIGTITTKADSIKGNVDSIKGNVELQPVTIVLSLIAALAAIAAAALILRKVYLK